MNSTGASLKSKHSCKNSERLYKDSLFCILIFFARKIITILQVADASPFHSLHLLQPFIIDLSLYIFKGINGDVKT